MSSLLAVLFVQMNELQERYPTFELVKDGDGFTARGDVSFSMEHDGSTIKDSYAVEILIPPSYPDTAPYARETGRRVPEGFHKLKSNCLCLGATIEVRKKFAEYKTLIGFVEQQIVPYLFSFSYFRDYGKMPFGEREHAYFGILQYYMEFWGVPIIPALRMLKMLADDTIPMSASCPCDSGQPVRECHGPALLDIHPHGSPGLFDSELSAMILEARAAGAEIPEQEVMSNRMLRNRRRNRRKKLTKR